MLKNLLNEARGNFCNINDLIQSFGWRRLSNSIIKKWIKDKIPELELRSPPPIESIALGALSMTPGKIRDILTKGLSIRLFNRREKTFLASYFSKGQTWPTENL